ARTTGAVSTSVVPAARVQDRDSLADDGAAADRDCAAAGAVATSARPGPAGVDRGAGVGDAAAEPDRRRLRRADDWHAPLWYAFDPARAAADRPGADLRRGSLQRGATQPSIRRSAALARRMAGHGPGSGAAGVGDGAEDFADLSVRKTE